MEIAMIQQTLMLMAPVHENIHVILPDNGHESSNKHTRSGHLDLQTFLMYHPAGNADVRHMNFTQSSLLRKYPLVGMARSNRMLVKGF